MTSSLRHHINLNISFSILPRVEKRNIFHFSSFPKKLDVVPGGGGGGGGTLKFFTCVGSGYFFGFKVFEFKYFLEFSKIKNIFGV